jgi:hypothetical protein
LRRYSAEEQATINLFQKNTPSVVYITNLAQRRDVFTLNITEVGSVTAVEVSACKPFCV